MVDIGSQEPLSPYEFSWNNPVTLNDPDGNCPCWAIPIIEAIITGIATTEAAVTTAAVGGAVVSAQNPTATRRVIQANADQIQSTGYMTIQVGFSSISVKIDGHSAHQKAEPVNKDLPVQILYIPKDTQRPKAKVDTKGTNDNLKHGGGKNAQHANQKARDAAKQRYEDAKKEFDGLSSKRNKTPEDKKQLEKLERNVKHEKKKMDNTGENHSRTSKGN